MEWIDISNGCGGHNGEYDWQCSECGYTDWQASYVNPNKDNTQCGRCGEYPRKTKVVKELPWSVAFKDNK